VTLATLLLLLNAATGLPGAAAQAQVTLIAGESFQGRLISLDARKAHFVTADGAKEVAVRDLWRIRMAKRADPMTAPGSRVIVLAGKEGMLAVGSLIVKDGRLVADSALLGAVEIELSAASAIFSAAALKSVNCFSPFSMTAFMAAAPSLIMSA